MTELTTDAGAAGSELPHFRHRRERRSSFVGFRGCALACTSAQAEGATAAGRRAAHRWCRADGRPEIDRASGRRHLPGTPETRGETENADPAARERSSAPAHRAAEVLDEGRQGAVHGPPSRDAGNRSRSASGHGRAIFSAVRTKPPTSSRASRQGAGGGPGKAAAYEAALPQPPACFRHSRPASSPTSRRWRTSSAWPARTGPVTPAGTCSRRRSLKVARQDGGPAPPGAGEAAAVLGVRQARGRSLQGEVPDMAGDERRPSCRRDASPRSRAWASPRRNWHSWNGARDLSLRDHRVQLLIRDATLWREAQAKAAWRKPSPFHRFMAGRRAAQGRNTPRSRTSPSSSTSRAASGAPHRGEARRGETRDAMNQANSE